LPGSRLASVGAGIRAPQAPGPPGDRCGWAGGASDWGHSRGARSGPIRWEVEARQAHRI